MDFANKVPYDAAPILDELRLDRGEHSRQSTQDAAWDGGGKTVTNLSLTENS
jgi:hypothetical protein